MTRGTAGARVGAHMKGQLVLRRATAADVADIAELVNEYAAAEIMLPRTEAQVALALDDYVVATDAHGRLLACGALREYSPSLAELVSLAVARSAHGRGLGRHVVAQVERLAVQRGFSSVFAHTLNPSFFEAVGYTEVPRDLYPEKRARPHTACFERSLAQAPAERWAVAA
jgi:amino-acid N-acetyltransferase